MEEPILKQNDVNNIDLSELHMLGVLDPNWYYEKLKNCIRTLALVYELLCKNKLVRGPQSLVYHGFLVMPII